MVRQKIEQQQWQYECKMLIVTLCMAMVFAMIPSTGNANTSGQSFDTGAYICNK